MHPRLADLALITLAPVLAAQGTYVRAKTPLLPEPEGPRFGKVGSGPDLSLLVVGDSAAAGVGADSLEQSLLGRLLSRLQNSHRVTYGLVARTGMTSREAFEELFEGDHAEQRWDVVVTSLGGNDATSLKTTPTFVREQRALIERARQVFGPSLVVLSGLPPMHRFPALPQPLRAVIGARAIRFDRALERLADETDALFVRINHQPELILEHIASDGFHPGPAGYAEWGARVGDAIVAGLDVIESRGGTVPSSG